jgi:crotonobetainyl-CoA:carnitine CoA-transferase CaiB-like acyl-CoA transferase
MISGPFAGQILADLGAEVVKLEPAGGDPLRHVRPQHNGMGALFLHVNRGKKSIGVDLKSPTGVRIARELALKADVVLENFRPGVMERLGLGYESLKAANPGLIFVSISGFGASGPYVDRPAYDHVLQGMSGLMKGLAGTGEPVPVRNVIVDKTAAMAAANATLAALLYRERNGGEGQRVSISLLDSFAAFALPDIMVNQTFLEEGSEQIRAIDIYHPVPTSDGHVIGHIQLDAQFAGLCKIFGRQDLIGDVRFKDAWSRLSNYEDMWGEMATVALGMKTADIVAAAAAEGVPLGPVNSVADLFEDPQAIHNATFFDTQDPELGAIRQLRFPAELEKSPARMNVRAPLYGEQSAAILEELGLDPAAIDAARASGAVR